MGGRSAIPRPVRADRRPSPAIALLAVLAVAAVLRLGSAFTLGDVSALHGDEGYYVRGARSLVAGDGYPGALRPPGYSAFLAAALALGGGSLRAARTAQIAVALVGIWAVYALVRRRFGAHAAVVSALVCALHPTLVFYSHVFWSETLVATLLLLALLCLDRFDLGGRDAWLAGAGLALGASVLVRDMLLFFVPFVVAWVLLPGIAHAARRSTGRAAWRDGARRVLLVVLPVLACVLPWAARNHALHGRLFLLSTNSWYPLAVGNLLPRDRVLGMSEENRRFVRAYDDTRGGELARAEYAREVALQAIAERQPGWVAHKLVRNTYYLFSTASQLRRFVKEDWLAPGWRDFGRRLANAEVAFHVLLTALGIAALWLVPGGRTKLLVVALILFHWGVYVVANATNRFRVPLLPFFALYVGPLLVGSPRLVRVAGAARWRMAGALASLATFAAIVATPLVRRLLVVLVVLIPFGTSGCRGSRETARPNVVLISIDTLRADHLGAYGYARPTSPSIDALAAAGVLFENALSPSSWTLPAHASLLSGVSPYRHGAVAATARIRDDVPLLAELLAAQGYHTVAFVNAPFVGRDHGFARGFARFEQRFEQRRRDVAERHRQVLDAVPALEPPFFLFVHYMDVHTPYRPPKEFNRFARDRRSSAVLKDIGETSVLELQRAAREGRLRMSHADRDRLIDLYDGEILAMDAKIGELVAALRTRFPDTIVILTSDHGEEFLEHGGFGHGETLYEEVLRVPLIVAGPGVAEGARIGDQASLLDVVPTVLERLGLASASALDGRSLLPFLHVGSAAAGGGTSGHAGATSDAEPVLGLHTASHDGTLSLRGVRAPSRKLVHDDRRGTVELYDLASDPGERRNLAPATRDERLEQALAALGAAAPSSAAPSPDPATVEALKALGYL